MTRSPMCEYFHGGVRGLRPGDKILPPSQTGALSMADLDVPDAMKAELAKVHRRDRVYLCAHLDGARLYAAACPAGGKRYGGSVYLVQPDGDIEPDPDWRGPAGDSIACRSATVIRIIDRKLLRAPYLAVLLGDRP